MRLLTSANSFFFNNLKAFSENLPHHSSNFSRFGFTKEFANVSGLFFGSTNILHFFFI